MKEFYQVCIAYALFCLCLLGVVAWSVFQDYKYGGNPEVEEMACRVDTIVVYKNGHDYDWELFTQALIWVESKGDNGRHVFHIQRKYADCIQCGCLS